MKQLPLTQGKVALIDDEDFESVALVGCLLAKGEAMKEVQYVVQIKTSVIRQVEFIDMPNLSAAEIEEYAKGLAAMEVGSFDESEILLVETRPTLHAPDAAKAAAESV